MNTLLAYEDIHSSLFWAKCYEIYGGSYWIDFKMILMSINELQKLDSISTVVVVITAPKKINYSLAWRLFRA